MDCKVWRQIGTLFWSGWKARDLLFTLWGRSVGQNGFPTTQKCLCYAVAPCVECSSDIPTDLEQEFQLWAQWKPEALNAADIKWIKLLLELR